MLNQEILHILAYLGVTHDEHRERTRHIECTIFLCGRCVARFYHESVSICESGCVICGTYDSSMELMHPSMGMKVVLVLLEARLERSDVAAEMGTEKSSYSSRTRQ